MKKITKKTTTEFVRHMLSSNSSWAVKAMVTIFEKNQTEMEQASSQTISDNGIGFSGVDGNILSSFSKQIQNGRSLSEKQMAVVFKLMPKYHKQIINLSDKEKLDGLIVKHLRKQKIKKIKENT